MRASWIRSCLIALLLMLTSGAAVSEPVTIPGSSR